MSLEQKVIVDLIEILENGCVQVREATRILDNGKIIASNFHRHFISPGEDYSKEDKKVQAICSVIHTPEVILAYQASREQP